MEPPTVPSMSPTIRTVRVNRNSIEDEGSPSWALAQIAFQHLGHVCSMFYVQFRDKSLGSQQKRRKSNS
jgi:hypothetical protein